MRKMARVWNLDTRVYKENFREKEIVIEPESFIIMDPSDAQSFLKAYTPVIKNSREEHLQPKKLKMELFNDRGGITKKATPKHVCPVDAQEFATQKLYDDHVKDYHMEQIVDKESKEQFEEELESA